MPSNVAVANNELVEVNNSLYGSTRMDLVSPIVTQYAGNEKNYSDGSLKNQVMKSITYDLVQRAEKDGSISALAELVNSASTELAQANVSASSFEYIRRALIIEITYSQLDSVSKTQPRARMLSELMKQYDFASYMGMFSNYGIERNPKRQDIANKQVSDLSSALVALGGAVTPLKSLGWNRNKNNLLTIAYTEDLGIKLGIVGTGRTESDLDVLMGEYEGATFVEIPSYLTNGKSRIEASLRPLVTHHHASLPSLYNDYTAPNGMSTVDMFSFETSTIELEEVGAIQRQLITIA